MKVILGMGSGRCGTLTLTKLLDAQAQVKAEHETASLWWNVNPYLFEHEWKRITSIDTPIAANVSFAWLPYVPLAVKKDPSVKCVCLKRDKRATVESFSQHLWRFNVWTIWTSPHFDADSHSQSMARLAGFPKFDLPRDEAIAAYWDLYYQTADEFEDKYPENFKIFPLDSFNHKDLVNGMLDFAGIEDKTITVGIKANERKAA